MANVRNGNFTVSRGFTHANIHAFKRFYICKYTRSHEVVRYVPHLPTTTRESISRIDYPPVKRESDNLPGNELAACQQRLLRGHLKPATAGHLHTHDVGEVLVVAMASAGVSFFVVVVTLEVCAE